MSVDSSPSVGHLRETLLDRRTVYEGRLITVHEDRVSLPGGRESRREVVVHPGAVAIVAVTEDRRVVLVRQWRHAVEGALWELTAGTCEPGESALGTATRELREETGYTSGTWRALGEAFSSPGYSRELISFFLADPVVAGAPDPDEHLDVELFDADRLAELVRERRTDCKTLAGLALAGLLPPIARP